MTSAPTIDALAARLRGARRRGAVITDRPQLRTYECDGLAHYQVDPGARGPAADDARRSPRSCGPALDAGVPFVARGSGTGLSGGALPHADGVLDRDLADARHPRGRPGDERAVVRAGRHQPGT